jgi:hypothetical protein
MTSLPHNKDRPVVLSDLLAPISKTGATNFRPETSPGSSAERPGLDLPGIEEAAGRRRAKHLQLGRGLSPFTGIGARFALVPCCCRFANSTRWLVPPESSRVRCDDFGSGECLIARLIAQGADRSPSFGPGLSLVDLFRRRLFQNGDSLCPPTGPLPGSEQPCLASEFGLSCCGRCLRALRKPPNKACTDWTDQVAGNRARSLTGGNRIVDATDCGIRSSSRADSCKITDEPPLRFG